MIRVEISHWKFPPLFYSAIYILGASFFLHSAAIHAQNDPNCAACSDQPAFIEPEVVLELNGMPPARFAVVSEWREAAKDGNGLLVQGIRVFFNETGDTFDLYAGENGALYSDVQLAALGIVEKNWDAPGVSKLAEMPLASRSKAQTPPPDPRSANLSTSGLKLARLDRQALLLEDEAKALDSADKTVRTGVFQVFQDPVEVSDSGATNGRWTTMPDGTRVWALTIESPGAIGQRVHFSELRVPDGVQVVIYNAYNVEEVYGPFPGPYDDEYDVWTPTCYSEAVTVECAIPAGVDATGLDLSIDRIVHVYRDMLELAQEKGVAGSCNLDVTCSPQWDAVSRGVVGLGKVTSLGSLFCTGTLIADNVQGTNVNYVLGANHCFGINPTATADSLEFYWFYQTDACDVAPPSILSVPRTTGGADFLLGSSLGLGGTDVALMLMRNDPPATATYVGWSTIAQSLGSATTCIHHPRGDYKRITFGTITDDPDNCKPGAPDFYQSTWTNGTTEPGSSGSPLFNSSQEIIGQLWGGCASCFLPDSPDYYGRFDVSYPLLESFLNSTLPEMDFVVVQTDAREDQGTANFLVTVIPTPDQGTSGSVDYTVTGVDATEGVDFEMASGTLTFNDLVTSRVFAITIIDDMLSEPDEDITITLENPTGYTLAGTNNPATLTILDDERDTDGDGIPDIVEGDSDFDMDGEPNFLDLDSDGDGIPDAVEGVGDPDGDLLPNFLDLDSDGDGIFDIIEGVDDPDADTVPNYLDLDSDGDAIPDETEGVDDPDTDSIPNYLDSDSDGDGIDDAIEGEGDPDGDSIPNYLDLESDGDGIDDAIEGANDLDGDLTPNFLDLDSDGDGIPDAVEGTNDADGDTSPNFLDTDSDGDTLPDAIEGVGDSDGDTIPNYLDTDSDGDGIDDETEGTGDADNDLTPNYLDLDSDGDGIPDATEGTNDTDGDLTPNYLDTDSDGDGIPDAVEGTVNSDTDNVPDYLDLDSDGDSIPDMIEGTGDPDGDMVPNYRDLDSDGDSIPDMIEGTGDPDGDAVPNFLDDDSDGDSIPDAVEKAIDTDKDGTANFLDLDSDNDGIPDATELLSDADGDDIPDYIDALEGPGDGFGRGGLLRCSAAGSTSEGTRLPAGDLFVLLGAFMALTLYRRERTADTHTF